VAVYNGKGFGSLSVLATQEGYYTLSGLSPEHAISLQASYDEYFEAISMDDPGSLDPPEPVPQDPHRRPFWLMKVLAVTMRSGGMLTPRLHVPRHIWFQSGAKFVAIEAKFSACENIYVSLNAIKDLDPRDSQAIRSAIEDFELLLDNIRSSLSKKLRFMEYEKKGSADPSSPIDGNSMVSGKDGTGGLKSWGSKLSRSLSTLGKAKAEKVADLSTYIELLTRVFNTSQVLEKWMSYFEAENSFHASLCLEKLRKISSFFGNVICVFVLKDFEILMERYTKKMGQVASLPM
jgi:hypothetical protein